MSDNKDSDENVLTLEPFIHQVGGRSTFLVLGQSICKPINQRELAFYETLPEQLKPFVPEFRGIIEVDINEKPDGYLSLTAKRPEAYKLDTNYKQNTKYRIRLSKTNGDILIENSDLSVPNFECNNDFNENGNNSNNNDNSVKKTHNPWLLNTFSLLKQKNNLKKRKFLLLENLISKFKCPNIMDLKIGTRRYDPTANEFKKLKSTESTSGTLGLRISGVQIYDKRLNRFICHNKYFGRSLTSDGLSETLKLFLQIENKVELSLILLIIERLENLLSVIKSLDNYRFYTSSLLIIYEGSIDELSDRNKSTLVDIRMIDFGHTIRLMDSTVSNGPDLEYMSALNNLIKLLKSIKL